MLFPNWCNNKVNTLKKATKWVAFFIFPPLPHDCTTVNIIVSSVNQTCFDWILANIVHLFFGNFRASKFNRMIIMLPKLMSFAICLFCCYSPKSRKQKLLSTLTRILNYDTYYFHTCKYF